MSNWKQISIGEFANFNPNESIPKGKLVKKIPMAQLTEFTRKINGYELAEYNSGPKFRNGDTLVAKITPCLENGKTAQVDILEDNEVAFGSSEFIVLRENENSVNDYIYYLAKSPVFRERAISCMEGTSGRKRVNEGALKRQEIIVPNKLTQQKIAKVLSDLDAKLELNNKINAELEVMAKTLYDYWFVQFDFPDANGKPYKTSGGKMVWNEELKREIPEGWKSKYLSYFNIYQPQTISEKELLSDGKYFVFGANGIIGKYDKFNHEESEIVVTCRGNSCGNIIRTIPKSWITGNAMVIKCRKKKLSSEFIYQMLNWIGLKKIITGSGQPQITRTNLETLNFILPDSKLLSNYDKLVKPLIDLKQKNILENQHLSSLRDWLLPILMNGQVKVNN